MSVVSPVGRLCAFRSFAKNGASSCGLPAARAFAYTGPFGRTVVQYLCPRHSEGHPVFSSERELSLEEAEVAEIMSS